MGVSAQNIEQLETEYFPANKNYLICSDALGNDHLVVNYTALIPVLIQGFKEQTQKINEQTEAINDLTDLVNNLKLRLETLENN